jgi:hypothetical protein
MRLIARGLVLISSLVAPAAFAQFPTPTPSSPPANFTVDVVSIAGSGCAAQYKVEIAPDQSGFSLTPSSLIAAYSGIIPNSDPPAPHPVDDNRRDCVVTLRVNAPAGYTYEIAGIFMIGGMSLRPNANPQASIAYWAQGWLGSFPLPFPLSPPRVWHNLRDDAFDENGPTKFPLGTDTNGFVPWITNVTPYFGYLPCGYERLFANLVTDTQLQINPDINEPESVAETGSIDHMVAGWTTFRLGWATCPITAGAKPLQ